MLYEKENTFMYDGMPGTDRLSKGTGNQSAAECGGEGDDGENHSRTHHRAESGGIV